MINEIKSSFHKFFKKWLAFSYFQDDIKNAHDYIKSLIKENQSLLGRIRILEEQQEIMHNFLVEINKYLVKITDTHEKCDIADINSNLRSIELLRLQPISYLREIGIDKKYLDNEEEKYMKKLMENTMGNMSMGKDGKKKMHESKKDGMKKDGMGKKDGMMKKGCKK